MKRIQRRRTKGWRMPEGAVYVGRPTVFGNPFHAPKGQRRHEPGSTTLRRVEAFQNWLTRPKRSVWFGSEAEAARDRLLAALPRLRGHDLACWCPLCPKHADGLPLGETCADCAPCHATALLELANQ